MTFHPRDFLPRSWNAFFGQFHTLTPIQTQAIEPILAGRDVLLSAPTASGKTEAFAAPAAEIVLAAPKREGLLVLIVSPTRALANDLKRRLESRFDALGVRFGRYTGEHKERIDGRMPDVAVTTPEALDSILARRPQIVRDLRLIVLDEIHVLDGTPRGDQLRVLLHRLDLVTERRPQRLAASATIDTPDALGARYLEDAVITQAQGARRIAARPFAGRGPVEMQAHLRFLAGEGFRKVLVFCRRRADVEIYASALTDRCVFDDLVFAHHGSLARPERERTERRFLESKAAVCFATMTLEMGIDIGSVDYVILASPPADVASLLQRIGRGGRRTDEARAGYLVASPAEDHRYRSMFRAGARSELLGRPYGFRPSVLAQQALIIAGADGWVDTASLRRAVPTHIWKESAPLEAQSLLDALVEAELLEDPRGGRYVLAAESELRYERGSLHANIAGDQGAAVIDRLTGDVLGHLDLEGQHRVNVAGKGRVVIKQDQDRVLTDRSDIAATPQFRSRGAPSTSFALARRTIEDLKIPPGTIAQWPHGDATILLHGMGSVGAHLLTRLLRDQNAKLSIEKSSPFCHVLSKPLTKLPVLEGAWLDRFVKDQAGRLAKTLSMGPFHALLPVEVREAAVSRAGGLDLLTAFLATATLSRPTPIDPARADLAAAL
ncbi:MAG: DEAD/DEAH box helicase [Planctomycetes bacterium]|nr:DEAD/DEAH box helicase [Planctomycetota bacterium]